MITRFGVVLAMITVGTLSTGCGSSRASAYESVSATTRDTARAQELSQRAAAIIDDDPKKAEGLLREALGEDLFYGPAHNNLGVIYLKRGELYSAANEFEWARKLMPGHPDPRINLALTLEKAGQADDAAASYRAALEMAPLSVDAMTGLARLQIRTADTSGETVELLRKIEKSSDDAGLRSWARDQRLRLMPFGSIGQ